jgi:nifR3 family TIM-barrel protein
MGVTGELRTEVHPLLRPVQIGRVTLEHGVVLAPMAGVCNLPFRLLCKEQGAALVCSEFVSAKALRHGNQKTRKMLAVAPQEAPVSIQIFASTPEDAAFAARIVEEAGADIVDFNMGCPVPKVIKAEAGAALMRVPDKAQAIIKAMVDAVNIPVTVKMRTGWDDTQINVVDLARRFEDVGVAAIAVHGRTRSQGRKGEVDLEIIRQVNEAVGIPVIGNGDVTSAAAADRMQRETGCAGVMIGRGALGNPWIFSRILHTLRTGNELPEPTLDERIEMARRHLRLLAELKGEEVAAKEMRQHAPLYVKGFPGAARFRAQLVRCASISEYDAVFDELLTAASTGSEHADA